MIVAASLQTLGIALPVIIQELWAAILSAIILGGIFVGIVSLILTMAGKFYPENPAKMMVKMTLAYGSAQILGPALTGWIGAIFGNYSSGLITAAVMFLGTGLLLVIKSLRLY